MHCIFWFGTSPRSWPLATFLAVLMLVSGGAVEAQTRESDCGVLQRLTGKWIGRGSLQRHSLSGTEPVRCRLDSVWAGARRTVESRLDCRGVDGDLTFEGSILADGTDGLLAGVLQGSQGLDQGVLSGWCETDAVKLDVAGRNPTTGNAVEASLVISLSDQDGTLTNFMEVRDPETGDWFPVLTVRFEQ